MKKIYFLIIALLAIHSAMAQGCLPEGITFTTQEQIDNFQTDYPGCTEIEGDVIITGNNITDLEGLLVLTSIGGQLRIENTSSLNSLNGLNNISFIGMDLIFDENESLISLAGLNGLLEITESLEIMENSALVSLSGLESLTSIGEDLRIGCSGYSWTGNPLLTNLSGLNSLSSIGNSLDICINHGLTDLSGIENLTNVENIRVSANDRLSNLNGLQGITNVDGYLTISWNDSLSSLQGLNNLATAGYLTLYELPYLNDRRGLEQLRSLSNDLMISRNILIDSLPSFDSLTYIGGKLTIGQDYNLIDLSGLENLTEIGAGLEVIYNHALLNINALSSVTSIGGDLTIRSNGELNSLVGMSGVTSIAGDLTIAYNSNLTSLSGIENIDPSTIEDLNISWMYYLTDCAFSNICEYLTDPNGVVDIFSNGYPCNNPAQIANECEINLPCLPYGNYHFMYQSDVDSFQINYPDCTNLKGSLILHGGLGGATGNYTNLDGLGVVTSIDGVLAIVGAYYLTNLSGLDNIDSKSISDLYIMDCPNLSQCEVQSICNYLVDPNGEVNITDNADGCNSTEEVEAACLVGIENIIQENKLSVFPNPSSNRFTIRFSMEKEDQVKLLVLNNLGQVVATLANETLSEGEHELNWNAEGIPAGVYFYNIQIGNQAGTGKLVLMK